MGTIMIVDDEALVREPIAAALRGAGYQTVVAGNGQGALGILLNSMPDLILLDLSMPEMDGLAFLKEFRSDPKNARIPVMLLTASAAKHDVRDAGKFGACEYILKSNFALSDLLARVAAHVPRPQSKPVAPAPPVDPINPPVFRSVQKAR